MKDCEVCLTNSRSQPAEPSPEKRIGAISRLGIVSGNADHDECGDIASLQCNLASLHLSLLMHQSELASSINISAYCCALGCWPLPALGQTRLA